MAVGQLRKAPVTRERPSIPSMPIPVSLLASPTQPHRGRVYSLPPENCTHFPTATKLGGGEGERERQNTTPYMQESPGGPHSLGLTMPPFHSRVPCRYHCPGLYAPARLCRELGLNTARRSLIFQGELTAGSRHPTYYKLGFQKPSWKGSSTIRQGRSQDLPELSARTPQPALHMRED